MKILVMGAGAVGAYYGARLQASGEDIVFCARGEQLRALKEHGLEIKSAQGDLKLRVKATERPADFAPYDLILFAVKSYDTEAVAPGKILHTALGKIEFGALDGRESPHAQHIADIFRRAGIFGELTTDLKTIRWHKLMGNNSTNSVGTLSRSTLGQMLSDPDGYALVRTLMIETVIVGRAEGANMSEERVDPYLQALVKNPQIMTMKPSTLQDLEKGKRLEYDGICGAVLRAARRHGIKVPATETVYTLLKLLDSARESGAH